MSTESAFLLGIIQGITEWIPVSSQGVVSVAATWLDGVSASDAIAIALWLHVGTAVSATAALRGEIIQIVREAAATPRSVPQPIPFLVLSTAVTGVVGVPLFLVLGEAADRFGAVIMVVIGVAMLVTAWVIRHRAEGLRGREDVGLTDAILVGAAQGIAVIPGLSRTGLTVAALLARGSTHREAVVLSVLMGIPASVGRWGACVVCVGHGVWPARRHRVSDGGGGGRRRYSDGTRVGKSRDTSAVRCDYRRRGGGRRRSRAG